MTISPDSLQKLRIVINENLRIQKGGGATPQYVDVSNAISDVSSRQNHVIFARRGCGKTLLLHESARKLPTDNKSVYLNCEDFKHHSFPNVLIEILDSLFAELERHLTGWFGKRKRSRILVQNIRKDLENQRVAADARVEQVVTKSQSDSSETASIDAKLKNPAASLSASMGETRMTRDEMQKTFTAMTDKVKDLNMLLPRLKSQVREFFDLSTSVKAIFLQVDDLYHLPRNVQPLVVDYIHRLCKDLPLYFKIATLRHASTLYADRNGQPIGAQERHDYQPINIDYTLSEFNRTKTHNLRILQEFCRLAKLPDTAATDLFKGTGFDRLVMAGGGVPRDTLSLFLEILSVVAQSGGERIGKDDVRILSRANFERRIEELKQDSEGGEQHTLMGGIHVIRDFCMNKKTNIFVVSDQMLQQNDSIKTLIYRLLDYRIIHSAGTALTHKSHAGTYEAFAIDIGCYAHLRKLDKRFNEIDVSDATAKEKMRSAPELSSSEFESRWGKLPSDTELEKKLKDDSDAENEL